MIEFLQTNQANILVAVLIGAALIVAALVFFTIKQQRELQQLRDLSRPRYGFLGKPLMSVLALTLLAGGGGLIWVVGNNLTSPQTTGAANEVSVRFETQVLARNADIVTVEFKGIPLLDSRDWGSNESAYDLYWTITGPTSISKVEVQLTQDNPGGFVEQLRPGSYSIKLEAVSPLGVGVRVEEITF